MQYRVINSHQQLQFYQQVYPRYGVGRSGFAYEENQLSTVKQIKQHEEYMSEQYLLSNVYIKGIWVPRSEDEVRDLRRKDNVDRISKYAPRPPLLGFKVLTLPPLYRELNALEFSSFPE